jgi:hypothetical protein
MPPALAYAPAAELDLLAMAADLARFLDAAAELGSPNAPAAESVRR